MWLLLLAVALAEVRLEGTPEVPADLAERLRPYLSPRSAALVDLSPDGSEVLVSTRFGETSQIHRVSTPLGMREQLTFLEEPVSGVEPIPGSEDLLLRADIGGDEQWQVLQWSDGRTTLLSDGEHRHGGLLYDRSGEVLAFTSNARNGRDTDVYVSGPRMEEPRRVTEFEGAWHARGFSADGQWLLVGHYEKVDRTELWRVHLASGEAERLTPEDHPAAYHGIFSSDPQVLYVLTDRFGEFRQLYRLDLEVRRESRRWTLLSEQIPWNVEDLELSPDGQTLAFVVNEEGYRSLRLMDTETEVISEPAGLDAGLVTGLRFARDANVLGLTMSGPTMPGDAFTLDLDSGELTRWTRSELGGLDEGDLVSPSLVRVESFDGLEIPAFVYRPSTPGPHPVVIFIHGGPEAQARPKFSGLAQYLVREEGMAVVIPNVRGSNGYGRTYLGLDDGYDREDSVRDIGAVLDWIAEDPELDESRVAVRGGSYGGYMVLASLVMHGDRLKAGIDNVGISSFVTFLENTKPYRQDLRRVEYGDERDPEMRAFLEEISPVAHADEITSALFVVHGANDPRVPVGEAEQIVAAVRGSGQEVWLMVALDEGHGFRKRSNRDLFYELTVLFLRHQLIPN
ncbi:MAG TPA: alpha/beta fold hydrolase [Myxococcota bacterium]|nr:alpha/beta fold hydrolase [Myxococcota bacterium]